MSNLTVYTPNQWNAAWPNLGANFTYQFLAQGDSWFSIGNLPPSSTSNLLFRMEFDFSACAVNYAQPGAQAAQMVNVAPTSQWVYEPGFVAAMTGNLASKWDAILMSAGGNDLICAILTPPTAADGTSVPPDKRLLLMPSEWGNQPDVSRFVSEDGWSTFKTHLTAVFKVLLDMRDGPGGRSQGAPLFVHSYHFLQPRNAGVRLIPAGPWLAGPWLFKAVNMFNIPNDQNQWYALTEYLMNKLFDLLNQIAASYNNFYVVNFLPVPMDLADISSTGESGDWINEIHPTDAGYQKLASIYSSAVAKVLGGGTP